MLLLTSITCVSLCLNWSTPPPRATLLICEHRLESLSGSKCVLQSKVVKVKQEQEVAKVCPLPILKFATLPPLSLPSLHCISLSSRTGIQLSLYIMYLHLPPPSPLTVVSWIYVFTWLFTFSSLLSPSLSPTELGPLNASPPQVCVAVNSNSRVAITKRNHKLDLLKRAKTLEDRVKWKDGVS